MGPLALLLSLPGAVSLARMLPARMPALVGARLGARVAGHRAATLGASATVLAALVALPLLGPAHVRPGAPARRTAGAALARTTPAHPAATPIHPPGTATAPGSLEVPEIRIDRVAAALASSMNGEAKAIAGDGTVADDADAADARDDALDGADASDATGDAALVDAVSGAAWQAE